MSNVMLTVERKTREYAEKHGRAPNTLRISRALYEVLCEECPPQGERFSGVPLSSVHTKFGLLQIRILFACDGVPMEVSCEYSPEEFFRGELKEATKDA